MWGQVGVNIFGRVRRMKKALSLPITIVIAASLLGSISATLPQTPGESCTYFPETGHYVCDEFLEFYKTRGEVEIFGYPLTEAFYDPARGLRVQYFQRARMEWHPYNPDPYKVLLGLLIDELGYNYPPARSEQIPAFNSTLHYYFHETNHIVSYAFLKYFREKGGLDIFGYPRSEFLYEDGYIVQYFQRARMEWHPEAVPGPQMRLTNVGEIYIERFGIPGDYGEPLPPPTADNPPQMPLRSTITELDVSASVRYAITGRQGTQTVFIYVNDQQQKPVQGAAVRMVIHYQSGDQICESEPTNANGFAQCSFAIHSSPPGRKVVIDVTTTYGKLTGTTQTFFLPWW
jgi:hypothetical protein